MFLPLVVVLALWSHTCGGVRVETTYGTVQGETIMLEDYHFEGTAINTFISVPFARPPVDDLRFLPPEEPDPWDGVYVADTPRSACTQSIIWMLTNPGWTDYDEDCLYLNVFAPNDTSSGPYPVMVWIHGGGYQGGNPAQYSGHFLAANNVVFVGLSYRLGIFGYGYTGDEHAPGNVGMLDMIMGLQFIQDNIAAFGGDPDRVTIFGQSGGSAAVGLLILSPLAEGLFHQAIYQSGTEFSSFAFLGPEHDVVDYMTQVAADVNCPTGDTGVMVDCMRSRPALMLHNAEFECSVGLRCLGFSPVVGDMGGFLPDYPGNMRDSGDFNKVVLMSGVTTEDAAVFNIDEDWSREEGPTREEFLEFLNNRVDELKVYFPDESRADTVLEALDWYYTPWPYTNDTYMNRKALYMVETDYDFGVPGHKSCTAHSRHATVYQYVQNYATDEGLLPEWTESTHGSELPLVMGTPFRPYNPAVSDQLGLGSFVNWTEEDEGQSIFSMTLWANFAKYGDPTPEPVPVPPTVDDGEGAVMWEPFTEEDQVSLYIGGETIHMQENYRSHAYAFWLDYLDWVILG